MILREIIQMLNLRFAGTSVGLCVSLAKAEDSFWAHTTIRFGIAYWAISVSLNIIFTCLIIIRLLIIRRQVKAIIGSSHGTHYTSIVAILVESASLYSAWALVFLITYARDSWVQNILLPPLGQIQVRHPPELHSTLLYSWLYRESRLCLS